MLGVIRDIIKSRGPISVAEYFKLALTHPEHGYYMKKDVFGVRGDFTTSPEISQMFGELIAVWIANEQAECAAAAPPSSSRPLHLVELGPGRGTLASDITRVATRLPQLRSGLTGRLFLCEVSPAMRAIQRRVLLSGRPADAAAAALPSNDNSVNSVASSSDWSPFETAHGFRAGWIDSLDELPPDEPCCFLAHEFLDALPVHKLRLLPNDEWREVLIGLASNSGNKGDEDATALSYRLADSPAPPELLRHLPPPPRHRPRRSSVALEISPSAGDTVERIARHVDATGGLALIADYGYDNVDASVDADIDTLRAFRSHRQLDPLLAPGDSDLTADVDFGYLKRRVAEARLSRLAVFGPSSQRAFLLQMGIAARLSALMSAPGASSEARRNHLSAARTLLEDMGQRFQFLCLTGQPHRLAGQEPPAPPPGFLPETRFT